MKKLQKNHSRFTKCIFGVVIVLLMITLIASEANATIVTMQDNSLETCFSFDSSPTSWVGRGYTDYFVSPDTGWTISASRNFDNGVSFSIRRDAGADPGLDDYYWTLELAAPFNETLTPGLYTNCARFPFQDQDQPGLTLSGNHRGNNRNGGFFEVLEAKYSPTGEVLQFAVDFTQYGEESTSRWVVGELRYNATPVPEPASMLLFGSMMVSVVTSRRFQK